MIPTDILKSVLAWFGEYLKNKPFTDLLLIINMLGMAILASWMRQDFKDAAAERRAESVEVQEHDDEIETKRLLAQKEAHAMVHSLLKEKRQQEVDDRAQLIELITGLKQQGKRNEAKLDAIPDKTAAATAAAVAETVKPTEGAPKE